MGTPRIPFRRRQFFIKQGFQLRFALFPLVFFGLFLLGAGVYLHGELKAFLQFQLYLSHSHLQNPWDEVAPLLVTVVGWGGGAFLLALGLWVWRRFGTLHHDLDCLADWLAAHARGQGVPAVPAFADREVRTLGEGLGTAVVALEEWDGRVRAGADRLRAAGAILPAAEAPDRVALSRAVGEVRAAWDALGATLAEVAVDESLS